MAIHIVLQGKGGVGKSLIASLITQYLKANGSDVLCIDTDPVNHTFSSYKAFNSKAIQVLDEFNNINTRSFDDLVEMILNHEGDVVIDNGASTFIPLSSYMAENNIIDFLEQSGKEVIIHSVITGGQALDDTLIGLTTTLKSQNCQVMVWENEFFGEIKKDNKKFKDSKVFENHKSKIKGIMLLPRQNQDTFAKDINLMLSHKLTFDEALESTLFSIMPKQRLKLYKENIFGQLNNLGM